MCGKDVNLPEVKLEQKGMSAKMELLGKADSVKVIVSRGCLQEEQK